jgi:hypothetical protein
VVVPYEGLSGASGIRSFSSDDGGGTWNVSVQISTRTPHAVPGVRTSPLPSAEISRIPLDPIGSTIDHFIPGLAVNRTSAGSHTVLALTYYTEQPAGCMGSTQLRGRLRATRTRLVQRADVQRTANRPRRRQSRQQCPGPDHQRDTDPIHGLLTRTSGADGRRRPHHSSRPRFLTKDA